MPRTAIQLAQQIRAIWKKCESEGREPTTDERKEIERLLDEAQHQKNIEDGLRSLDSATPVTEFLAGDGSGGSFGSPGHRFVQSEGFKRIADPATRGHRWTSGAVEVSAGPLRQKAGTIHESGQGAGLIPVPQVLSGVSETLFEQLGVADVFSAASATTSSVRYVVEGTADSGAAGVAEGGAKPPSDLALSTVDEPIRKIATSIVISDELLDDGVVSVSTYLNSRLSLFVKIEEERQLLRGAGTNELVGLMDSARGINAYDRGTIDNNAVALAKVIANTRGSSFLEPDAIVMHPSNWLATRLLQDGSGQFYGGGPFTGGYGNPGVPGLFGESLWGKRVVLSSVVGAGTALVGSFGQGAQLFRRGGVTVEMTNSHADLFLTDEVAVRAEERLGLAVFRPAAFTAVSGLS
jgi:HK97 family phage major capsid protein